MLSIMKNTLKVLFKKTSVVVALIVVPAIVTIFFSFMMGGSMSTYGVGVIDNDKGIVSKEIIKNIERMDTVKIVKLDKAEVDTAIVSKEIELCVVIDKGFSNDIISQKTSKVNIKCIGESEVKATVENVIDSTTNNMSKIASIAGGNKEKFNEYLKDYNDNDIKYKLNKVTIPKISVERSIGYVLMIIFGSAFFITRFILEDQKGGTQERIFLSNLKRFQYYMGRFFIFFICSAITSVLYYIMCIVFKFDFKTNNSIFYLYILLASNFVAIAVNLVIVTMVKSESAASNISILIVVVGCMLSGVWWPFEAMPDSIQQIGEMIPLRWSMIAFENIQKGYSLAKLLPQISSLLICGLVLLIVAVFLSNRKLLSDK